MENVINEFIDLIDKDVNRAEELQKIGQTMRRTTIDSYMTECSECSFKFMPMLSYVKGGLKFAKCGECGELLLVSD